jgi:OmpA-OmpF porin, OOP family
MKAILITCISILILLAIGDVKSQVINPGKILGQKVIRKTNQVINKTADKAVDSLFAANNEVKQKDNKDIKDAKSTPTPPKQNAVKNTDNSKANNGETSLETYSKFDFVPGEKVIFFDDFSQDNIGDFPALWNTNGSGEIVSTNLYSGRWLKFISRNAIWSDQLLNLPENYTIEFDVIPIKGTEGRMAGYDFRLIQSINAKAYDHGTVPGKAGFLFSCEYFGRPGYRTYINSDEGNDLGLSGFNENQEYVQKENKKYHVAIWVQKSRVRLYLDQNKLFDLPKAFPVAGVKMDRIRFEEGAAMISNVRVAAGTPDTRNKLLTEGKLISYGIYFDVNKDEVKPESYTTLKSIADVMNENTSLRIKIVGHTDSDGNDASNLDLSKRRAASVKNELGKTFSIDASRIEIDGKGASQPLVPNNSVLNKATNRRVEFIKL